MTNWEGLFKSHRHLFIFGLKWKEMIVLENKGIDEIIIYMRDNVPKELQKEYILMINGEEYH